MFKYIRFTPLKTNETTLTFRSKTEDVKVNYFDRPFVSIQSENEADIDVLIASQPSEIDCKEITKDEFVQLVKLSSQYQRILLRGTKKLSKLTKTIKDKYPEEERETWSTQLEEAKKYKKTLNEDDAPFLKTLAENENDTVEAFANAVIENNEIFKALTAKALSEKRVFQKKLLAEIGA